MSSIQADIKGEEIMDARDRWLMRSGYQQKCSKSQISCTLVPPSEECVRECQRACQHCVMRLRDSNRGLAGGNNDLNEQGR
jgi:hypothetical protein